jgi:DNA-binding LacI/PurR family transcriptional regulator
VSGRITIHELARLCNVSPTTISHAFTGKRHVEEQTKARILAQAAALGYRPNRVAQALRGRRTGVIGLALPFVEGDSRESREFLSYEYFMRVAAAAASASFKHGYALMLLPHAEEAETLQSLGIDGLMICDPDDADRRVALCKQIGLPLVTIGRDMSGGLDVPYVSSDCAANTHAMLNHLAEAGACRIGLLSTVSKSSWERVSEETYRTWCRMRGQEPVVERASFRKAGPSAREAADRLLSRAAPIDAVLVLEELHGKAFLDAALERGLQPPRDLLIAVAADGIEAMIAAPSLTAINLNPDQQASAATEILIQLMNGGSSVASQIVPARIVIRDSTARDDGKRPAPRGARAAVKAR